MSNSSVTDTITHIKTSASPPPSPPTQKENSTRRKCLMSQTRETVAKVYDFLKKDATEIMQIISDPLCSTPVMISNLNDHLNCVRKRTAKAVGVSERTITSILGERKRSEFKTPFKDRKKRAKKLELDDHNVNVIHSTIKNYQSEHQKLPSLITLKKIFQKKLNYGGCISTLRTALIKLGYVGRKTVKRRVKKEPSPRATQHFASAPNFDCINSGKATYYQGPGFVGVKKFEQDQYPI